MLFQATSGDEKFVAGTHRFPFEYKLPGSLSSSFEAKLNGDKAFARILYLVKLEVTNPDTFRSTLRDECLFKVCAPNEEGPKFVGKEADADISGFFCCGSRGTIKWSAKLNSDTVFPDDVVTARISVDNRECQAPVKGVSAQILRRVLIEVKNHAGSYTESVCKSSVPVIIEAGSQKDTDIQLTLPKANLQPSVDVGIFKCTYSLILELEVPRSFNPQIELPLRLTLLHAATPTAEKSSFALT